MKKLIAGLGLIMMGALANAQGLEHVYVEKFYVSNSADAAANAQTANGGPLPVGSVTYRIYADMQPGYKFQVLYGVAAHELRLSTTTVFFNTDNGDNIPNYNKTGLKNDLSMLDSWFSVGGATKVGSASASAVGIPKAEDTDGSIAPFTSGALTNNDPSMTPPALNVEDGMIGGIVPQAVTYVGLSAADLGMFSDGTANGNLFSTFNGSVASLNGSVGATSSNKVLIGQFTTDGRFCYKLNIQIGTPSGGTENYVWDTPTPGSGEIQFAELSGCLGANTPPTVSITSPANGANVVQHDPLTINATAADADGTVSSVEFFVDGASIGVDNSAPYSATWGDATPIGTHTLIAKATDSDGATTTSSAVVINVLSNPPPVVSITNPANGASFVVGDVVAIAANATDNGSVASVEFFVDGVSIGTDNTSPYNMNWTSTLGGHSLTARATDNLGAQATSAAVNISVVNNIPPTVSITAPANGASFMAPTVVAISANAGDADGSVAQVEFFVNGVSVGVDATSPYSVNWTSTIGSKVLTAKATDNRGAVTASAPVNIEILDPNALPYKVGIVKNTCLPDSFCLPIIAVDTVKNVIGYDLVLHYNKVKVRPTGGLTKSSDLLNSSYFDVYTSVDTTNGLVNLSAFLNSAAPSNAVFHGVGTLACVEFRKTPAFQSVDTANFSITGLQESYYSQVKASSASAGNYSTYKDSLFHGKLVFWKDSSAIKYNAANPNQYLISNIRGTALGCAGPLSLIAVQPDTFGNFIHSIWNGKSVNINRDILPTTDVQPVVNGADALLARKVLLNDLSFIPNAYQIVSMDVNLDGVVSAGDVSQINQRTVLMIPEFKQAWNYNNQGTSNGQPSKDWLFLNDALLASPAYHRSATYPGDDGTGFSKSRVPVAPFCLPVPVSSYDTCPLIMSAIYKGVMLGDVNGNYASIAPDGMIKREADKGTVVFDMSKATSNSGYFDVPVSIASFQDVNALDFALQYNESKLAFVSVIDKGTIPMEALSNYNAQDKTVRFTSNSFQNYMKNTPVVTVRFAMLAPDATGSDVYSLNAYLNGERVRVSKEAPAAGLNNIGNISIYPNPAADVVYVQTSEAANVQLLDLSGRQIMMETHVNANEKSAISLSDVADGVYMMRIYNGSSVTVQKIVVNR